VDGAQYLNVAPEVNCGTSTHQSFVIWAVVMLIVFCIGVPMLALLMLFKYRKSQNEHVQMVLRFLYDGFKPDRYYWEMVIVLRKFLIVVFIIILRGDQIIHQILGMTFVVQAALLIHVLFRPYTSGRQYRLELMSLVAILITLFASLYIYDDSNASTDALSLSLSTIVLVLNVFVVVAFAFFIGRGLMRRFMSETWAKISRCWKRTAPAKMKKSAPKLRKILSFFECFAGANDYDRDLLYANLERWWKYAPNYNRRRLQEVLRDISQGTPYSRLIKSVEPSISASGTSFNVDDIASEEYEERSSLDLQ